MGYKIKAQELELPGYQSEPDPQDNLIVRAITPTVSEGATINAGRRTKENGFDEDETSEAYQRRVMGLMAPKIRFWNLEEEDGTPVPIPLLAPALQLTAEEDTRTRLSRMVDHLYEQDENVVLAIYHAWRLAGLPKRKDTAEGKDSGAPSTPGPDASPRSDEEWDLRELETQIPM